MAPALSSSIFLFLLLPKILAVASPSPHEKIAPQSWPWPWTCDCPQQNETHLHMYLHQFPDLPNIPNPDEVSVLSLGKPHGFGNTVIDAWILTEGPDPNGKIIGRAHGMHIQAGQISTAWYTSHSIVLLDGSFAGSTLQVMGFIDTANFDAEWSILGGTGELAKAQGTIMVTKFNTPTDVIRELDIDVFYSPKTSTEVTKTHY